MIRSSHTLDTNVYVCLSCHVILHLNSHLCFACHKQLSTLEAHLICPSQEPIIHCAGLNHLCCIDN